MGSNERKLAMFAFFLERGLSSPAAARAVLASMPFDDSKQPMPRQFEKEGRKLSKTFAKAVRKADDATVDAMATNTLLALRGLAVQYGDAYYTERYDTALNAAEDTTSS